MRNTLFGKNCIVKNHAFLCDSLIREDNDFISQDTILTNDLYPQVDVQVDKLKTIEKGATMGAN